MASEEFDKETAPLTGDEPGEKRSSPEKEADETTGASPGTAQACDDLGLNSLEQNLSKFGIKPPGVA